MGLTNPHLFLPGSAVRPSTEHYDENTLFKVYDALRESGLTEKQSRASIAEMQNAGILFRERTPDATPAGPVYRGVQQEAVHVAPVVAESTPS